jgi:hypothetical protein
MDENKKIYKKDCFFIGGSINSHVLHDIIKNGYDKSPTSIDEIQGYHIDKDLSGRRSQVYFNPTSKHLVINNRGTVDSSDVYTDLKLMLGYKSGKRFQHGKRITDEAIKKYDSDNVRVSLTGHSLGHAISKESNKNHKHEVIGINGAVSPVDLMTKQPKNETMIRSTLDPVSFLHTFSPYSSKKHTINIDTNSYNPFTNHNSDILKQLGDTEVGV